MIKGAKMTTCIFSMERNNSMRLMLKYIVIKRENFDRFRFWANNAETKNWLDCQNTRGTDIARHGDVRNKAKYYVASFFKNFENML